MENNDKRLHAMAEAGILAVRLERHKNKPSGKDREVEAGETIQTIRKIINRKNGFMTVYNNAIAAQLTQLRKNIYHTENFTDSELLQIIMQGYNEE